MKRIVSLLFSLLMLSATGFAQDDKSVARLNFDIPGMDAAMAAKAVAVASAVPGVTVAKANEKNTTLMVSMAPENRSNTRKAVQKALRDAGIKVATKKDAKKNDREPARINNKADKKPGVAK